MSKPLELTIYPPRQPRPVGPEFRIWFHECLAEGDLMTAKRLTEAELCAVYWANESAAWREYALYRMSDGTRALEDQSIVLLRFATSPHLFETDAK